MSLHEIGQCKVESIVASSGRRSKENFDVMKSNKFKYYTSCMIYIGATPKSIRGVKISPDDDVAILRECVYGTFDVDVSVGFFFVNRC